jgi:hypothetical protein
VIAERPRHATEVLVAGLVATVVLCSPSLLPREVFGLSARPAIRVLPFVWPAWIAISAILEPPSLSRALRVALFAALAAIPVGLGPLSALEGVEESRRDALPPIVEALGASLGAALAVELAAQLGLGRLRAFAPAEAGIAPGLLPIRLRLAALGIIALAAPLPLAGEQVLLAKQRRAGRTGAEADWARGEPRFATFAGAATELVDGDILVYSAYDPRFGLPARETWTFGAVKSAREVETFFEAYNERTAELVAERGPPPGAEPRFAIPARELAATLDLEDVQAITSFPHDVTASVHVDASGVRLDGINLSRWPFGGNVPPATTPVAGPEPVVTGALPGRPGLLFVRWGNRCIYIVSPEGKLIAQVMR